jgi:hypothetical protein
VFPYVCVRYSTALAASARASLMGGKGLPLAVLHRAEEIEGRGPAPTHVLSRASVMTGQWLKHVDDFDGSRSRLLEARRAAIEEGDESSLPNVLMHLALCELWAGRWADAASHSQESVERAEQIGQGTAWVAAVRSLVDAHGGRVERAGVTADARWCGARAGANVGKHPIPFPRWRRSVAGVSGYNERRSYLVECYWPGVSEDKLAAATERTRTAASELRLDGHELRFLGSILVLADETVFCLFDGLEADVRAVSEQAGVPFERVLESLRIDGNQPQEEEQ